MNSAPERSGAFSIPECTSADAICNCSGTATRRQGPKGPILSPRSSARPVYIPCMENRYVMFFDFLGASNAARTWKGQRVVDFVDLLRAVSGMRATWNIEEKAGADGRTLLSVTPEVTTFSDNVVVSYADCRGAAPGCWAELVCDHCAWHVARVADRALQLGILVRGGISYGPCIHEDSVVFGPGMVDAYELESDIAVYPRVVVSERVLDRLSPNGPETMPSLFQDEDGQWSLNYIARMATVGVPGQLAEKGGVERWKEHAGRTIRTNVSSLEAESVPWQKWKWLDQKFRHFHSRT